MPEIVKFEKIVPEGKALGYWNGQACFCIGPLPGETAEVAIAKHCRGYAEARLLSVKAASAYRHEPPEGHFMICSPWQGVDYDYQIGLKRQMLAECMARPGLELEVLGMVGAPQPLGYRNKLEFSLAPDREGRLELGFHERGSLEKLVPLPNGCLLGSAAMNETALKLLERLQELDVCEQAESLTVRQSQTHGDIVGIVSLRGKTKRDWGSLKIPGLAGVAVSRFSPGRNHELVWQDGRVELAESLGGVELQYSYDGFFQVNVPMFERALERILEAIPAGARVVDLYGGPGTIGLQVAKVAGSVTGIEIQASAVEEANANAGRNALTNYEAIAVPAERMNAEVLRGARVVIVDPPRAGLHKNVIGMLLKAAPERIIYLSCNPVTQARDLALLTGKYETPGVKGFDFYPGTLHLESLAILTRR